MGCIIFVKPYEGKEIMANKDFWEEYGKKLPRPCGAPISGLIADARRLWIVASLVYIPGADLRRMACA